MSDILTVYDDINKEIEDVKKRLNEMEKHANGNMDIINEILSWKDYLKEKEEVYYYVKYLMSTLSTMREDWRKNKYIFLYYYD